MQNSHKGSKYLKRAFRALKMLKKFGYSVLGQMGALSPNRSLFLGNTKFTWDITLKFGHSEIISNLRFLLRKCNLVRIWRQKFRYSVLGRIGAIVFEPPTPRW